MKMMKTKHNRYNRSRSECVVYFYVFYWPQNMHMYVGQTDCIERRFAQHNQCIVHGQYNKCIRNSYAIYGMPIFKVLNFKCIVTEQCDRTTYFEQHYYDFFRSHGYTMVNPTMPKFDPYKHIRVGAALDETRRRHSIAGKLAFAKPEVRARLRQAQQERFSKPGSHEIASNALHTRYANIERRQEAEASQVLRYSKQSERDKISAGTKARYARPGQLAEQKARLSLSQTRRHDFARTYGTASVYHYKYGNGKFMPWMNFIIVDDEAIVFVWDTRQYIMTCKLSDMPNGYERCFDNHKRIIGYDTERLFQKRVQ